MIVNFPFLANKDIYSDEYTKEKIFKTKFVLTIILWIIGIAVTYLVFLTAPAIASSDPEVVFYTYDMTTTLAVILLSSSPFLFIAGLLSYITYGCSHRTATKVTLYIFLSYVLVAIPIIVDEDILITIDGSFLLMTAIIVTIICIILFFVVMGLSKKKYLNTEYPWKDVMK